MAIRFFKKEVPKMPVVMPNGDQIHFESFDKRMGYYATDNEDQIAAFIDLERKHRGGVFVISQEEYERDFLKKKEESIPFDHRSVRREEISMGLPQDTMVQRVKVDVVAPVAAAELLTPAAKPEGRPSKGPTVGRRSVEP